MHDIMSKWGLTVHVGHEGKKSKTEEIFILFTTKFKEWRQQKRLKCDNSEVMASEYDLIKRKLTHVDLNKVCDSAPETKKITLHEGGYMLFTLKFTYLGSHVDFIVDGTEDVKIRINKASKSIGALKITCNENDVPLDTKMKLHNSIPLNVLLWGGDNWSGNKGDIKRIETF